MDIRCFFPTSKKVKTIKATETEVMDGEQEVIMYDELKGMEKGMEEPEVLEETDDAMDLEHLLPQSWQLSLKKEWSKSYFQQLKVFLQKEKIKKMIIYPAENLIFTALQHCTLDKIKVLILGQDPYHGPNQAHGLAFSVQRGIQVPPSLRNIYKEALNDVQMKKPMHGDLSYWSEQGVLLLNTCLTVRKGQANSHQKRGWETFTDAVIRAVDQECENVVFILWGGPAGKKADMINGQKHLILQSSHPSPLGATKTKKPFMGSKCFSKTNEYLELNGKDKIDWQL